MVRFRVLGGVLLIVCVLLCGLLGGVAWGAPSVESFAIVPGSFRVVPSSVRAGAHADLTVTFDFAHNAAGKTFNDARGTVTNLPVGFDANNTAVPTCTDAQLVSGTLGVPACPVASQIGLISFEVANPNGGVAPPAHITAPVYNMEVTSFGVTAEIGFKVIGGSALVLQASVRPGEYGITTTSSDVQKVEPHNVAVTIWGLPAAHEHDAQRGEECGESFEVPPLCIHPQGGGGPQEAGIPVKAFLSNPTGCEPHTASMEADSWEDPETWLTAETEVAAIVECERVPFEPSIEAQPTTKAAESPSGLNVSLLVPQAWDNPFSLSTANLKDARVTLPVGFTINPSAGSGLGACTPAQYERETAPRCPVKAVRRNRRSVRSKSKRLCWRRRSTARYMSRSLLITRSVRY